MELRHLRYFLAVAENLSFRRAADRLHLTRPALSKQIKELEDEIGARLLHRTTAKVSLTPAGTVLLQEVRGILGRVDQAVDLTREAASGRRGQLTLGEPGVLGLTFLTPVLAGFRTRFPHVEITLRELPPSEHPAAVEAGEIHVGFTLAGNAVRRPALDHFTVLRLRVGAAVGPDHPFARRRSLALAELAGQTLICVGDARVSEHDRFVRERLAAAGLPPPRVRIVPGIRSLMTMVASGHGVSLIPDSLAGSGAGDVRVVPLRDTGQQFELEVVALWRRQDPPQLVLNFVRAVRTLARHPPRAAELGLPG